VDVQVDEGGLGHREGHSTPASGGPLNRLRRVRKRSSEPRRPDAGPRPQGGHSSVQGGFGRHSAPDRPVPEWLGRERLLLDETRPAAHPSTLERRWQFRATRWYQPARWPQAASPSARVRRRCASHGRPPLHRG